MRQKNIKSTAAGIVLIAGLLLGSWATTTFATPVRIGVVPNPCAYVPIHPTAAHKSSNDWYDHWMKDWLDTDWGQRCRYQAENAALPKATSHRIVFLGDSITESWKEQVPDFFKDDRLDRGISGQTTEQMLVRMRGDVLDLHPAVVHIMAGTNDVAGNRGPTSVAQIESNLQSLIELARSAHIRVVIGSILPAATFGWSPVEQVPDTIRAVNQWLKDYARHHRLIYVDYHLLLSDINGGMRREYSEDGVHPNVAGYAVMQPLAEAAMKAALEGHAGQK